MALLDPIERGQRGLETEAEVTGRTAHEPATLFEQSWRDFVFAEVWTRPDCRAARASWWRSPAR